MPCQTLLPDPHCLTLDRVRQRDGEIVFDVRTTALVVACPLSKATCDRVHPRYRRKLLDLPWQGNAVKVEIACRKFFCDNRDCHRRVFAEPLPNVAVRYARRPSGLPTLCGN
jgi:transposase